MRSLPPIPEIFYRELPGNSAPTGLESFNPSTAISGQPWGALSARAQQKIPKTIIVASQSKNITVKIDPLHGVWKYLNNAGFTILFFLYDHCMLLKPDQTLITHIYKEEYNGTYDVTEELHYDTLANVDSQLMFFEESDYDWICRKTNTARDQILLLDSKTLTQFYKTQKNQTRVFMDKTEKGQHIVSGYCLTSKLNFERHSLPQTEFDSDATHQVRRLIHHRIANLKNSIHAENTHLIQKHTKELQTQSIKQIIPDHVYHQLVTKLPYSEDDIYKRFNSDIPKLSLIEKHILCKHATIELISSPDLVSLFNSLTLLRKYITVEKTQDFLKKIKSGEISCYANAFHKAITFLIDHDDTLDFLLRESSKKTTLANTIKEILINIFTKNSYYQQKKYTEKTKVEIRKLLANITLDDRTLDKFIIEQRYNNIGFLLAYCTQDKKEHIPDMVLENIMSLGITNLLWKRMMKIESIFENITEHIKEKLKSSVKHKRMDDLKFYTSCTLVLYDIKTAKKILNERIGNSEDNHPFLTPQFTYFQKKIILTKSINNPRALLTNFRNFFSHKEQRQELFQKTFQLISYSNKAIKNILIKYGIDHCRFHLSESGKVEIETHQTNREHSTSHPDEFESKTNKITISFTDLFYFSNHPQEKILINLFSRAIDEILSSDHISTNGLLSRPLSNSFSDCQHAVLRKKIFNKLSDSNLHKLYLSRNLCDKAIIVYLLAKRTNVSKKSITHYDIDEAIQLMIYEDFMELVDKNSVFMAIFQYYPSHFNTKIVTAILNTILFTALTTQRTRQLSDYFFTHVDQLFFIGGKELFNNIIDAFDILRHAESQLSMPTLLNTEDILSVSYLCSIAHQFPDEICPPSIALQNMLQWKITHLDSLSNNDIQIIIDNQKIEKKPQLLNFLYSNLHSQFTFDTTSSIDNLIYPMELHEYVRPIDTITSGIDSLLAFEAINDITTWVIDLDESESSIIIEVQKVLEKLNFEALTIVIFSFHSSSITIDFKSKIHVMFYHTQAKIFFFDRFTSKKNFMDHATPSTAYSPSRHTEGDSKQRHSDILYSCNHGGEPDLNEKNHDTKTDLHLFPLFRVVGDKSPEIKRHLQSLLRMSTSKVYQLRGDQLTIDEPKLTKFNPQPAISGEHAQIEFINTTLLNTHKGFLQIPVLHPMQNITNCSHGEIMIDQFGCWYFKPSSDTNFSMTIQVPLSLSTNIICSHNAYFELDDALELDTALKNYFRNQYSIDNRTDVACRFRAKSIIKHIIEELPQLANSIRYVVNSTHAFILIKRNKTWAKCDLGGGGINHKYYHHHQTSSPRLPFNIPLNFSTRGRVESLRAIKPTRRSQASLLTVSTTDSPTQSTASTGHYRSYHLSLPEQNDTIANARKFIQKNVKEEPINIDNFKSAVSAYSSSGRVTRFFNPLISHLRLCCQKNTLPTLLELFDIVVNSSKSRVYWDDYATFISQIILGLETIPNTQTGTSAALRNIFSFELNSLQRSNSTTLQSFWRMHGPRKAFLEEREARQKLYKQLMLSSSRIVDTLPDNLEGRRILILHRDPKRALLQLIRRHSLRAFFILDQKTINSHQHGHLCINSDKTILINPKSPLSVFLSEAQRCTSDHFILFINWETLSNRSRLRLNTIIDDNHPSVFGQNIPANVSLIGVQSSVSNDPSFLSRHDTCYELSSLDEKTETDLAADGSATIGLNTTEGKDTDVAIDISDAATVAESKAIAGDTTGTVTFDSGIEDTADNLAPSTEMTTFSIDLSIKLNWKSALFGRITLIRNRCHWQRLSWIDSARESNGEFSLTLNANPAQQKAMSEFISLSEAKGYFEYHHYRIPFPKHGCLLTEKSLSIGTIGQKIRLIIANQVHNPSSIIINTEWFDTLLSDKIIHDGCYSETPGILHDHAHQALSLHITNTLSDEQWYTLVRQCDSLNITLSCYVEPFITIPHSLFPLIRTTTPESRHQDNAHTNDPSSANLPHLHLTQDLMQTTNALLTHVPGNSTIIDIDDYTFPDLFIATNYDFHESHFSNFTLKQSDILKNLFKGNTVILRGKINPQVLNCLHPVLARGANYSNKEWRLFKGKLHVISEYANQSELREAIKQFSWLPDYQKSINRFDKIIKRSRHNHYNESKRNESIEYSESKRSAAIQHGESKHANKNSILHPFIQQRLRALTSTLQSKSGCVLVGDAGIGKSRLMEDLRTHYHQQYTVYCGMSEIEKWLMNPPEKSSILFLDESNLTDSHLTSFSNLFDDSIKNKMFLLQGKLYSVPSNAKVVFACNPVEDGGGRLSQRLFSRYFVPTLLLSDFPACFIEEVLIGRIAPELPVEQKQSLVKQYLDKSTDISTVRQLQHIALQQTIPQIESEPLGSGTFTLTPSSRPVFKAILRFLQLRESKIVNKNLQRTGLNGLLIEGEPACGKSALIQHVLDQHLAHTEAALYVKIDAIHNVDTLTHLLVDAFHQGQVVWIDEINSLSSTGIEQVLNGLLTGVDPTGQEAIKPGFCLLATANASSLAGRDVLSPALASRLEVHHHPNLTQRDAEEILKDRVEDSTLRKRLSYLLSNQKKINLRQVFSQLPTLIESSRPRMSVPTA